nr:DegT/DnrJ/EryC1/StrS family aminotransferase [Pseudomonas nitroreducens]
MRANGFSIQQRDATVINVTKTYLGNLDKFKAYVEQIYASGWITNHGPFVTELEERLQDYFGVRHVILTNNGTIALQVAYRALGVTGSAVTTPFSFVATSSTLQWESIRPRFADIDARTWNLDPARIEASLAPDTTAIVATHVFGNPCAVEEIQAVAQRNRLKVIYDGAHAFGSRYRDRSVLAWGDATTLSFHATKLFHTIEGGAIVTSDDELAKQIRLMCNFGIAGVDQIVGLGINAKLNEFSAAMGLCVLDEIDDILAQREEIAARYTASLSGYYDLQASESYARLNNSYYPIGLRDEAQVLRVRTALNEIGVNPRRYFYPSLDTLDYLAPQVPQVQSRELSQRILCLPLYPGLPQEIQRAVIEVLLLESGRVAVAV